MEDGRILYTGHRFTDVQTLRHGVFIWDAASGETRCLLEQDRYLVKLLCPLAGPGGFSVLPTGLAMEMGKKMAISTPSLSPEENQSCFLRHSHHCVGNTVATDSRLGAGDLARLRRHALFPLHRGPGQPD